MYETTRYIFEHFIKNINVPKYLKIKNICVCNALFFCCFYISIAYLITLYYLNTQKCWKNKINKTFFYTVDNFLLKKWKIYYTIVNNT